MQESKNLVLSTILVLEGQICQHNNMFLNHRNTLLNLHDKISLIIKNIKKNHNNQPQARRDIFSGKLHNNDYGMYYK